MPLILGTNSIKDTGYDVANSCRFNDGSSDRLSRTQDTGNQRTYTFSFWIKRQDLERQQFMFGARYSNLNRYAWILFNNEASPDKDRLNIKSGIYSTSSTSTSMSFTTTRVFRDTSAWYHIVIAVDTTQSTESNRVKIYINGVQETSFTTSTYPSQNDQHFFNINTTPIEIGAFNSSDYFSGYMSEVVLIDSQQLDATSFGEFDEDSGIWKPIDVSGLTFGTNGFYLDFEDSSALGNDVSGNNNDFTVNNLTAIDQSTDTCTNNFATMNPLDNYYASSTFSEGNCKIVTTGGNITYNTSTIGFSSGKWYMEVKLGSSSGEVLGVVRGVSTANDNDNKIGNRSDGWGYDYRGLVEHNGSDEGGSFASYSSGNIIGIYVDLDNNKLYFSKDGALQNSGTGLTLTAGTYFFAVGDNHLSNAATLETNFGSPTYSISSSNTDDNGYGNFEYSPNITGDSTAKSFYALNTKNLSEYG